MKESNEDQASLKTFIIKLKAVMAVPEKQLEILSFFEENDDAVTYFEFFAEL